MGFRVFLFTGLATVSLSAQDPQEEAKQRKAFQARVKKAVGEFRKRWQKEGLAGNRVECLETLKDDEGKILMDDAVFAELLNTVGEGPEYCKALIRLVREVDHEGAAKVLEAAGKKYLENAGVMAEIAEGLEKEHRRWDIVYRVAGECVAKHSFTRNGAANPFAQFNGKVLKLFEDTAPIAAVEPLIDLIREAEEVIKQPNNDTPDNRKAMEEWEKILRACSEMPDLKTAKEYSEFWKANQVALMKKNKATEHLWCPKTFKRWSRSFGDTKRYCKHHGDESLAKKDRVVIAFRTMK